MAQVQVKVVLLRLRQIFKFKLTVFLAPEVLDLGVVRFVTSWPIERSLDDVFSDQVAATSLCNKFILETFVLGKGLLVGKGEIGSFLDFYKNFFQKSFVSHF